MLDRYVDAARPRARRGRRHPGRGAGGGGPAGRRQRRRRRACCTCSAPATPSSWPSTPTRGPAGLACVNPILDPALSPAAGLDLALVERTEGRAAAILEGEDLRAGEVVLVVSNSGVNAVPVEVALGCRERGLRVVALTNLEQAKATAPRHPSGARLHELADVVIDNRCPPGDAAVTLASGDRVGPLTTVVGAAVVSRPLRPGGRAAAGAGPPPARAGQPEPRRPPGRPGQRRAGPARTWTACGARDGTGSTGERAAAGHRGPGADPGWGVAAGLDRRGGPADRGHGPGRAAAGNRRRGRRARRRRPGGHARLHRPPRPRRGRGGRDGRRPGRAGPHGPVLRRPRRHRLAAVHHDRERPRHRARPRGGAGGGRPGRRAAPPSSAPTWKGPT